MKIDPVKKKALLEMLKSFVIEQLKGAAVKAALKAFLKTGFGTQIQTWLITFVVEELFEQVGEPIIKAMFLKMGYYYNRIEGKVIIKRINEARENNDGQAYDHAVDDIFIE